MSASQNNTARQMNAHQRKAIVLQTINSNVTQIANKNQVSRGFIHKLVLSILGQSDSQLDFTATP